MWNNKFDTYVCILYFISYLLKTVKYKFCLLWLGYMKNRFFLLIIQFSKMIYKIKIKMLFLCEICVNFE